LWKLDKNRKKTHTKFCSMKLIQIPSRIELCMREIILGFEMIHIRIFKLVPKYVPTELYRPSGTYNPLTEALTQELKLIQYQFWWIRCAFRQIKCLEWYSARKKLEIRRKKNVKTEQESKSKTQILCHDLCKDRAMHEGDNPLFWDEFTDLLSSWQFCSYSYIILSKCFVDWVVILGTRYLLKCKMSHGQVFVLGRLWTFLEVPGESNTICSWWDIYVCKLVSAI
jgi:hypothetical protein